MKKTITRKDGTVEVFEGTPEELAEWERRLNETPVSRPSEKKKEKKVLNEQELRKLLEQTPNVGDSNVRWNFTTTFTNACDADCFYLGRPWFGIVPPPPCSSPSCPGHRPRQPTFTWASTSTTPFTVVYTTSTTPG